MVEMALAHSIPNKTEAAYRRGRPVAKRFELMEAWATYAAGSGCCSRRRRLKQLIH